MREENWGREDGRLIYSIPMGKDQFSAWNFFWILVHSYLKLVKVENGSNENTESNLDTKL